MLLFLYVERSWNRILFVPLMEAIVPCRYGSTLTIGRLSVSVSGTEAEQSTSDCQRTLRVWKVVIWAGLLSKGEQSTSGYRLKFDGVGEHVLISLIRSKHGYLMLPREDILERQAHCGHDGQEDAQRGPPEHEIDKIK